MGLCAICAKSTESTCYNCCKVFYCNKDHMVQDKEAHKPDCFPALLKYDDKSGRFFYEATRTVLQGELLLREESLLSGPSPNCIGNVFNKICLGCYQIVDGKYECGKCRWYMCSKECEMVKFHAAFECELFASRGIGPKLFTDPLEYLFILLLRYLLMNDEPRFRERWDRINKLKTYYPRVTGPSHWNLASQAVVFIQDRCKLRHYDTELIKNSLRHLKINSLDEGGFRMLKNSSCRQACHIFPKTSFMPHSCSPNTYWSITTNETTNPGHGVKFVESHIQLRAAVQIRAGERFTRNYFDVFYDTPQRKHCLEWLSYETCSCQRCEDPSEFGVGLTCIKCRSCRHGYLLPKPAAYPEEGMGVGMGDEGPTTWICSFGETTCSREITNDVAQQILANLSQLLQNLAGFAQKQTNVFKTVNQYTRLLKSHEGVTVHENHWILIRLRYQLIECYLSYIVNLFRCSPVEANNSEMVFAVSMYRHSQHLLELVHALCPGFNLIRGRLLYYQVQALICLICKCWHHQDYIMLKAYLGFYDRFVNEGKRILLQEPECSYEYKLGTFLGGNEYIHEIARATDAHFRSILTSAPAASPPSTFKPPPRSKAVPKPKLTRARTTRRATSQEECKKEANAKASQD